MILLGMHFVLKGEILVTVLAKCLQNKKVGLILDDLHSKWRKSIEYSELCQNMNKRKC